MQSELSKKIKTSIKLINLISQSAEEANSELELCYSGGKDSDVLLRLTQMANVPYTAIYRETTIDPPGTRNHALNAGAKVREPKLSFREIIEKKGFPSRYFRFCCEILKEYKILDFAMTGVRADESKKRTQYKEPSICRIYKHKEKVQMMMPILNWTRQDVSEFITTEGIKCHPIYYNADGVFHAEIRLGCIGCPLANWKFRVSEFEQYPKFVKLWIKAGQAYLDSHPNVKAHQYFRDAADMFAYNLWCNSMKEFEQRFKITLEQNNGLPPRTYIENTFNIDLSNIKPS